MTGLNGKTAIVIGSGIGGLSAAAALATHFGKVLVLERDRAATAAMPRSGVPHGNQAHALLLSAQRAFAALLPGFEENLEAAGAISLRQSADGYMDFPNIGKMQPFDIGLNFYAASRPLIESTLLQRVAGLANVTIMSGTRVEELVTSPEDSAVIGVRHKAPSGAQVTLNADLVVDSTGRNSTLSRDMLARTGRQPPDSTEIGMEIAYTTGIFTIPDDPMREWKYAYVVAGPPAEPRSGLILPIEKGRWLATMVGRFGDRPPGDLSGFLEFARGLRSPVLYEALKDAAPEGTFARFVKPGSVWRHFERLENPPRGWLPLGDAVSDLNPVYGQGMAVAAQEAVLLRQLLDEGVADLGALTDVYLKGLTTIIAPAWSASLNDLGFAQTTGKRPPDLAERMRFSAAVAVLSARDRDICRVWTEVTNLLRPPTVFQTPELVARIGFVMAEMAART